MNDRELQKKVLAMQEYCAARVLHPETDLIYNNIDWEADDRWEKARFESPEDVRRQVARNIREANVDDCAIRVGTYLPALADCYELTGDANAKAQADRVFRGAVSLYEIAPRKGFIVRGIHPADKQSYPLNSSVDQYTWYVYGLYRFYHSTASSPEQKAKVRQIIDDMCRLVEAEGFDIWDAKGAPTRVSDIGAIRSDRSSRLLELYIVGYDITGDVHWLEIYKEKVAENRHARLYSLLDPERVLYPHTRTWSRQSVGAILQTQVSLVPLYEKEPDVRLKACYKAAMELNAEICEAEPEHGRTAGLHCMLLAYGLHLAGSVDCPHRRCLADFLRDRCRHVLEHSPPWDIGAIASYWTAVKKGLFG